VLPDFGFLMFGGAERRRPWREWKGASIRVAGPGDKVCTILRKRKFFGHGNVVFKLIPGNSVGSSIRIG